MTGLDPVALISTAITSVGTALGGVAGPALVVGGSVLALTVAWGLARRFVKA